MAKKYAKFNQDGMPVGFFDDEINEIESDYIEITHEQWSDLVKNQGHRKWEDGVVVDYVMPFNEDYCITEIKGLSRDVILSIASISDQLNFSARAIELLELIMSGDAVDKDFSELEDIRALNIRKNAIIKRTSELITKYVGDESNLSQDDRQTIKTQLEKAGE